MRFLTQVLAALLLSAMGTAAAPPATESHPLVVHEWGTFLSMNGSDGAVLDGMYHEEHALPGFVHARSRDRPRRDRLADPPRS